MIFRNVGKALKNFGRKLANVVHRKRAQPPETRSHPAPQPTQKDAHGYKIKAPTIKAGRRTVGGWPDVPAMSMSRLIQRNRKRRGACPRRARIEQRRAELVAECAPRAKAERRKIALNRTGAWQTFAKQHPPEGKPATFLDSLAYKMHANACRVRRMKSEAEKTTARLAEKRAAAHES